MVFDLYIVVALYVMLISTASTSPLSYGDGQLVNPQAERACANNKVVKTDRTANFDDLAAGENPRPLVPTPYQDLSFPEFYVESYANEGFIIPATPENYAIAYNAQQAGITAIYPGSKVKSFALKSLYYACDQGVPQAECDITVTGYGAYGKDGTSKVVTKTVVYPALVPPVDPSTLTMKQATFGNEWDGLQSVNFSLFQATDPGYAALVIDEVEYVTSDCT